MGRQWKGTPVVTETPGKLVHSGEYVCTEQKYNTEYNDIDIWTYNYQKKKAANESYLYISCMWNSLEAYSYGPTPCIRADNQIGASRYIGSMYFWGFNNGSETAEMNLHSTQNYVHSETLNGYAANIDSSNFGVGTVPIIVNWTAANGGNNRPGHTHAPNRNSGGGSGGSGANDTRGETHWYSYIRVWEIAY